MGWFQESWSLLAVSVAGAVALVVVVVVGQTDCLLQCAVCCSVCVAVAVATCLIIPLEPTNRAWVWRVVPGSSFVGAIHVVSQVVCVNSGEQILKRLTRGYWWCLRES